MKLKYTTKLFIAVNLITVAFRTLQIFLLTESGTAFLKEEMAVANVIIAVVSVLSLAALALNASQAVRQPEKINCSGIPSVVALGISGSLYLAGGIMSVILKPYGWKWAALMSLLVVAATVMFMRSAVNNRPLSKVWPLAFIAYWVVEFVEGYLFYTERPLRVRTVYEAAAMCFVIVFSVTFGKAVSGVRSEKSFRRIYPLGLVSSALCIVSVVPEMLAALFGFGEKVTESAVMPVTLVAAAAFTGFFTINTFKKSNTVHPKAKRRREMQRTAVLGEFENIQSAHEISATSNEADSVTVIDNSMWR